MAPGPDSRQTSDSVFYIDRPTVPVGMTITQYRRARPRRATRWTRTKRAVVRKRT